MDSVSFDSVRLQVGQGIQYFFDNLIVEAVQNLSRRVHSPVAVGERPVIERDRPWEQVTYFTCSSWRVVRDPRDGIFQCWYEDWHIRHGERLRQPELSIHDPRYFPSRYLFARSKDGIHWEKPELDLVIEEGRKTNVVLGDTTLRGPIGSVHSGYVFLDSLENDAERRYKILFNHRTSESDPRGGLYAIASSPDGIHWELWKDRPSFGKWGPHLGDVLTVAVDLDSRTYICNTRHPAMGAAWRDPSVPALHQFSHMYYPEQPQRNNKRRIFQARSSDLIHWSEPQPILVPDDERDNLDDAFYGMSQHSLGDMWVGFLDVFHDTENTMDVELLYSRNGRDFARVEPGKAWLTRGEPGSWDALMVNAYGGPVDVGDELYVYHGGAKNHHDWWIVGSREGLDTPEATDMGLVGYGLGLKKMKRNRFVSLSAGRVRKGILVTKPFHSAEGKLVINALCRAGGGIRVAAADGSGRVLEGFEEHACRPFEGDSTSHVVRWENKDTLPGGWRKLFFYLRDADLFTFRFAGQEPPGGVEKRT